MKKQVDIENYYFFKYCDQDRFVSYWNQLNEILKLRPINILEIGVGDSVVSNYIKKNTDINYNSLDIDGNLNPNMVGNVLDIPSENEKYDLVCAFEVLEHLPFDKFSQALNEMKRVSRKNVLISLPHWGRYFSIKLRIPFLKIIRLHYKLNIEKPVHIFNGQHYWEIGKKGYKIAAIKNEIAKSGLILINDFVCFDSPYHHFFILKKNNL